MYDYILVKEGASSLQGALSTRIVVYSGEYTFLGNALIGAPYKETKSEPIHGHGIGLQKYFMLVKFISTNTGLPSLQEIPSPEHGVQFPDGTMEAANNLKVPK